MIFCEIICFEFSCVAGARMTDPKLEELVLDGIASNPPAPIRTKLVPAKVQFEDVLYRTHVIDLV